MDSLSRTAKHEAAILNAAYMVRHYYRGAQMRSGYMKDARTKAIQKMGEAILAALIEYQALGMEYEPILTTIVRGLGPDEPIF